MSDERERALDNDDQDAIAASELATRAAALLDAILDAVERGDKRVAARLATKVERERATLDRLQAAAEKRQRDELSP